MSLTTRNEELTVFKQLKSCSEKFENKTAVEYKCGDTIVKVTYGQFFTDCKRAAGFFRRKNITGGVIALSGKNDYAYFVALYSGMFNGNIVLPVNPLLSYKTLKDVFDRRRPDLFIYDEDYTDPERAASDAGMENMTFKAFLEKAGEESSDFAETKEIGPDDICINILTSGTTGTPKLVQGNHIYVSGRGYDYKGMRLLAINPLHHLGGIFFSSLFFSKGGTVCISSLKDAINDLSVYRPEVANFVPSLIRTAIKLHKRSIIDLSCLKSIVIGTAPCDIETFEFLRKMGIDVSNNYGSTEAGLEFSTCSDPDAPLKSVGKNCPFFEARLDKNNELLVKGRTVMKGYYNDEAATSEVLRDGWYHTGDKAEIDGNGYIFIKGRVRNIICLSNGENISPEAIENELNICEQIVQSVVSESDDKIATEIYYGSTKNEEKEKIILEYVKTYNKNAPVMNRIGKIIFRYTPFNTTANGKIIR